MIMDSTSPILDSDNESDADVLELHNDIHFDSDENQTTTAASSTPSVNQNIESACRDLIVAEQMERCLTRREVTNETASYTDMDDPNYQPKNDEYKRKQAYSSIESNQKTGNTSDEKGFVEKMKNIDNKLYSKILPVICESEEKPMDLFVEELCTNLHENNTTLMFSITSKIDRKIILDKYNETCLIEANGGQMIKSGIRRRTSGGIFFNLITKDESIPKLVRKDLLCGSQNGKTKKEERREKNKRIKENLKKLIALDKKKADHLNTISEELETLQSPSSSLLEDEDWSL